MKKNFLFLLVFLITGCKTDQDFALFDILDNASHQSDCGGFVVHDKSTPPSINEEQECRNEKILWQYNSDTGNFTFIHKNISTDCAKNITVTSSKDNITSYTIHEVMLGEPTDCLCFYDVWGEFIIDSPGSITLAIETNNSVVWQGDINLSLKKGVSIIKKDVGYCD